MSGSAEEPPGTLEAGPPEPVADLKETYEQSKNHLESVKYIMQRNKENLKKKEEELQEYAKKLSKFKTRGKNRPRDDASSSTDSTPKSKSDTSFIDQSDDVDNISQARTPKAKSSLLQRKLAEDRELFEQRSRELSESKKAVEEKVEALKQQLEERYVTPVSAVSPVLVTSQSAHPVFELSLVQDKDNKISALSNKIIDLEAIILDLQENLKEKDSVIDSKTKAVTLLSADLSKKGKTTLDTLEDTKDEMRSMQENFVLVESSLRDKNDNLVMQLEEKTSQISELESQIQSLLGKLAVQKEAETVSADFSRSTMDTLADTKDAMKSMQENFVLIEESLKSKNESLLQQLHEREMKLAEAEARILSLESGFGIERYPDSQDLMYKIEKLEKTNRELQDEKYELQKSIADLQDKIVSGEPASKLPTEDNSRILELENLIEELRASNAVLEQECTKKLQDQIADLNEKNQQLANKVIDLESQLLSLETEKSQWKSGETGVPSETSRSDEEVQNLTKELEELNKSMIKLKAQHKKKLSNLQKQLENFKKVSDINAELVNLGNQVALLEEEKASAGEWQQRISDLEGKVSSQAKEIETHINAIAILENQKLDLMQELHASKQELSSLEAEIAESENLRVTAEMKVVDLEEELESLHKRQLDDSERAELQRQIASLAQENERLSSKLKNSSDVGSTDSFVKTGSNVDSTESFEAIADADKSDLLRKIDGLTRENGALVEKLARLEEKGSSDSGSTESFERIPETTVSDTGTRLEALTRENFELVVKVTKLEEKLSDLLVIDRRISEESVAAPEVNVTEDPVSRIESHEDLKSGIVSEGNEAHQVEVDTLEAEIHRCNEMIAEQKGVIEDMRTKLADKEAELERHSSLIDQHSGSETEVPGSQEEIALLKRELEVSGSVIQEWKLKCSEMQDKLETLESAKQQIEQGLFALQQENRTLVEQSEQKDTIVSLLRDELEQTVNNFEARLREQAEVIASQEELVEQLRGSVGEKERELQAKYSQLQSDLIKLDELQDNMSKLQTQLQQRDITVASLNEEVETLRTNSSLIEEDLFHARHQLSELHERLEKSKSIDEYNQLLERLNDKEMLVEELESKVSQRTAEVAGLKSQLDSFVVETQNLRQRLEAEESKAADLLEGNREQEEQLRAAERAKVEVENRLLELQAVHENQARHAGDVATELQEAYRMLESLKFKHMEDMEMLNRRLEDALEELQEKTLAVASLTDELEKNNSSSEAKIALEAQVSELERKLTQADEKAQQQLDKMKKYAAVAKKKTAQCEDLEGKLRELEQKLEMEKHTDQESGVTNQELHEKDNRITSLEEELQKSLEERDEALKNLRSLSSELEELKEEMKTLADAKDNARELGVRMHVMETEYVDQMSQISTLKTENGLLLSKQAQINERLENVEKESEERRAQLEKFEKEKEIEEARRTEECGGQCASRLQALEAKLQERDAEIENLDNELHNSIGNLVQMQENLRLSTLPVPSAPPGMSGVTQESYNELMMQFNALTAANQEAQAKYEATLRENEELSERVARLSELNDAMTERIQAVEKELNQNRETVASYDNLHAQYVELLGRSEQQKIDLEASQSQLREALESHQESERRLREQIDLLEKEKITVSDNVVVESSGWDLEAQPPLKGASVAESFLDSHRIPDEESPPLFDASVFGGAALQNQAFDLDKNNQITQELQQAKVFINSLSAELQQARDTIDSLTAELRQLRATRDDMEIALSSRSDEVSSLTESLNTMKSEYERLVGVLNDKNASIDQAQSERNCWESQLEEATSESPVVDQILVSLGVTGLDSFTNLQKLQAAQVKLEEMSSELETLRIQNQELWASQEVYRNRALELESEVRATGDVARIAELENRIARVISERDILQLQMNDVNRVFEDLRESNEAVKDLESQLEAVTRERNKLAEELCNLKDVPDVEKQAQTQQQVSHVDSANPAVECMWDDDEDPWGFNDKYRAHQEEEQIHMPIVPSEEIQMKIRIDELEEKIKSLTEENVKLVEDGKAAQIKIVKYVKKLKENKVQLDNLQRQLKSQSSLGSSGFDDLDAAIVDELKNQVATLQKALSDAKDEIKKAAAEKEKLLQRIEVLTAATERFTEAKEKQDNEVHIWQVRYRELETKLQQLDFGPETKDTASSPRQGSFEASSDDSNRIQEQEELKELKDNVEALAAENEELQRLLEEYRTKKQSSTEDDGVQLKDLQSKNEALTTSNEKLKSDYNTLRKQYEQSLMEAEEQVQSTRSDNQILHQEIEQRTLESNYKLEVAMEEKTLLQVTLAETQASLDSLTEEITAIKEQLQLELDKRDELERLLKQSNDRFRDEVTVKQAQMDALNTALMDKDDELANLTRQMGELGGMKEKTRGLELSIEAYSLEVQEKSTEIQTLQERIAKLEQALANREDQVTNEQGQQTSHSFGDLVPLSKEHQELRSKIVELESVIAEKDAAVNRAEQEIQKLRLELENSVTTLETVSLQQRRVPEVEAGLFKDVENDIPVFTFASDDDDKDVQLKHVRAELMATKQEMERLQSSVNNDNQKQAIQKLQDEIHSLLSEKSELEQQIIANNQEINALKSQLHEFQSHQDRRKRSMGEQEELMRLQNEIHDRDQQINDLKYTIAEKDSELRVALQEAAIDYESHETAEKLRSELEQLELRRLERLVEQQSDTIDRLSSENWQAKEDIERILREKEIEIESLRRHLSEENQSLMQDLNASKDEISNLRQQLEQHLGQVGGNAPDCMQTHTTHFKDHSDERFSEPTVISVSENEKLLEELEDKCKTELETLRVQNEALVQSLRTDLTEKNSRIEELTALSVEEHNQLTELRKMLEVKEQQINGLTQQLDEKIKEYELMQYALQRHVGTPELPSSTFGVQQQQNENTQTSLPESSETSLSANELDLALYMLHQRDVRCEELTHELMQLLEERDTLQLRLSNAIRVNEELRKYATSAVSAAGASPTKDLSMSSGSSAGIGGDGQSEPLVENPSPSKSEGPVEIAREAINLPIDEDKIALAQKLSQLRSVDQGRDVRLRDERELRHSQQMSLLTHGDLSKLPAEAAARLVNANYTLSRDVQSQSSVLMNWLWGKRYVRTFFYSYRVVTSVKLEIF
ncbi:hypothetical protein QAD02_005329 [Eretmocerus hayati]|uniref:Uncharacterized protein n=1 Tax=Eretmocerus hayati TaxID=131215 RepID=A0ACC2NV08_9HYME|nr:hypothetical protein QAD02_005329 [Eretmocerus hayati]